MKRKPDDGQATIEAALTLPVVLIALLLIVQVGVVVRDALALAQAAREGARAVAVSGHDGDATFAIMHAAGPLDTSKISTEITPDERNRTRGDPVTVRVSYIERLTIPIVSKFISTSLPLRASATERLETAMATPSPGP